MKQEMLEDLRDSRWRMGLEWNLEHRPQESLALHQQGKLGPMLDNLHQQTLTLCARLVNQGYPEEEAFQIAAEQLMPSPTDDRPEPLPENQQSRIRRDLTTSSRPTVIGSPRVRKHGYARILQPSAR